MHMTITRLKNIPLCGISGIDAICRTSDLPKNQTKYLIGKATELEMSGSMNTYLLLNSFDNQILGYFTIGPKLSRTLGTPIFEVTNLFGITEDIENTLIEYAMNVVKTFNEKVCYASISARCKKEQFSIFSNRGFVYNGCVSGGYIRMQYLEFR